ncbi:MAG: leucine-rich repeat domain-containing protein, partial [Pseudanabaena sp.]
YLGNNQLTSIPAEIGNLTNITELDLSYNQLTSLPPEIANLQNLVRLDIRGNAIDVTSLSNLQYGMILL